MHMMNYIWSGMIVLAIIFAVCSGNTQAVSDAVFSAADEAVTVTLKMLGMFCLWGGLMRVAQQAGLTDRFAKLLSPLLNRLFPGIRNDATAKSAVSMNITANLFGLGNAATPLGIEAMRRLKRHAPFQDTASNDMILFVVLNSACIRLIPTTVAMLRHDSGSHAPMEILPATLCVSFLSCAGAILLTKLLGRKHG